MLKIPSSNRDGDLEVWCKEVIDECMASEGDRAMIYTRAAQYYYTGTYDSRAAIYNKTKGFIDKLSGFLMQPTDVRFAINFDSSEPDNVLERAQLISEKLSADYIQTDSDVTFSEAVTWSLINGCHLLKHYPSDHGELGFKIVPVHPQNFGVLGETIIDLDEQEAFVHVTYPTMSRLRTMLQDHPRQNEIMKRIEAGRPTQKDEEQPSYFHQMIVGGLNPLGDPGGSPRSEAAGIVNVFPVPTPWKPNRHISPTVKFCELWIKDRDRGGDYTTISVVYPDVIIEGGAGERRNLSKVPGHSSFIKIQPQVTPGYFWGRSLIADIQMLQDVLNKRLRDIKVMWDRNVNAPRIFSGFTSITEEQYYKIISEGGFINDPNPNAKTDKLAEPPPVQYLEELQFLFQLFDEAAGFTPIMSGQGEPGVRAGVHAQTLVRTSSPRLIDQASRIERQLAESGHLSLRIMQAMDPLIYTTDTGIDFLLSEFPDNFQVSVDSHSASPAFAEDNRQTVIALARQGALDNEDMIRMLHPPGAALLLANLRKREKRQAQAAQQEEKLELVRDVLRLPDRKKGQAGRRPK